MDLSEFFRSRLSFSARTLYHLLASCLMNTAHHLPVKGRHPWLCNVLQVQLQPQPQPQGALLTDPGSWLSRACSTSNSSLRMKRIWRHTRRRSSNNNSSSSNDNSESNSQSSRPESGWSLFEQWRRAEDAEQIVICRGSHHYFSYGRQVQIGKFAPRSMAGEARCTRIGYARVTKG